MSAGVRHRPIGSLPAMNGSGDVALSARRPATRASIGPFAVVFEHRRTLIKLAWILSTSSVGLAASALAGPDANWDLLNYHYSNGRALVTGTFRFDVGAAGLESYLHPLIDAPVYLAVELTDSRWGLIVWLAI